MKINFSFTEHFQLSRKEALGYLTFSIFLVLLLIGKLILHQQKINRNNALYESLVQSETVVKPKETVDSVNLKHRSSQTPNVFAHKHQQRRPAKRLSVNINAATAEELQELRGIGPVYSKRIVKYRDLLGGFYSKKQLVEVYGIEDSLYRELEPFIKCSGAINKILINSVSENELSSHPYCSYKQAKLFTLFKKQHGSLDSLDQILKIREIDTLQWKKIWPYLSLE